MLNSAQAAIGHAYYAMDMSNLCSSKDISCLVTGLVKSGSTKPMKRSSVMPLERFKELFLNWGDNDLLSIKQLRLKCVTLLAIYLMLRPSDIAPHSVNLQSGKERRILFGTDQLNFQDDGSVIVTFFGIKNDTSRSGFNVVLRPHVNTLLDPVDVLKMYITKTAESRKLSETLAVFLSLNSPYHALTATSIAGILSDAISQAGLDNMGFSAKSFRPSGATTAVDKSIDPNIVQSVGRWKSTDVFYQHYIHSKPPEDYTTLLL